MNSVQIDKCYIKEDHCRKNGQTILFYITSLNVQKMNSDNKKSCLYQKNIRRLPTILPSCRTPDTSPALKIKLERYNELYALKTCVDLEYKNGRSENKQY